MLPRLATLEEIVSSPKVILAGALLTAQTEHPLFVWFVYGLKLDRNILICTNRTKSQPVDQVGSKSSLEFQP